MNYDFDTVVERRGTDSLKYDASRAREKGEELLPMWVADMDFRTAPEILARLHQVVEHGIFGYSDGGEAYFEAVRGWYGSRFAWTVKKEWLIKTPGVVYALAASVRAFTEEGDAVLLQQPVYYPFGQVIRENGRRVINNPLKLADGHYEIDFEDFEEKIIRERVKLFLLCNPHNPVGRVFSEQELRKMGEICKKHGVLVVSDEIHSDFVYPGREHRVFASLSPAYEAMSVTCTAPSKTFNLAGLQVSNIFIPDEGMRGRFLHEMRKTGYSQVNRMGLAACQAAYEQGGPWLAALKEYLADNVAYVREFLQENLPEITLIEPEGTYLLWLDFRKLGLTEEEREELLFERAGLWLDSGVMFGDEGEGFERINIACPRKTLEQAMSRLAAAVGALRG